MREAREEYNKIVKKMRVISISIVVILVLFIIGVIILFM